MDEIIKCTVLGVAAVALGDVASNPSGREIWTGVRIQTSNGKKRFIKSALIEAEASIIINEAIASGRELELWFSGKEARYYVYGIKSNIDDWYHDEYTSYLSGQGVKWLIIGVLTIPILGIGVLLIIQSLGYFVASSTFAPRYSREIFKRGYDEGVRGRTPEQTQAEATPASSAERAVLSEQIHFRGIVRHRYYWRGHTYKTQSEAEGARAAEAARAAVAAGAKSQALAA